MSSGMRWHARPSVSVLLLLRCGVLPWVAPEDECGEQDLGKLQQDHGLPRRVLIAATPCASHEFPADTVLGAHRCEARARKHGSSNIEALMLQFLRFCWSTSSVFCVCACVCVVVGDGVAARCFPSARCSLCGGSARAAKPREVSDVHQHKFGYVTQVYDTPRMTSLMRNLEPRGPHSFLSSFRVFSTSRSWQAAAIR